MNSEFEDHVVSVAKLTEMFLHHIFEGWGATIEDDGIWRRLRHLFLEHILRNETAAIFPIRILRVNIDCVE